MKGKNKFLAIMVEITIMAVVATAMTFVTEWISKTGFFGDTKDMWGIRHVIYILFLLVCFFANVMRIITKYGDFDL